MTDIREVEQSTSTQNDFPTLAELIRNDFQRADW